jgi:hypothetical protein
MAEYIYLIRCNEFVKIGISSDIEYRLSNLQVGNPYQLQLLHKIECEKASLVEGLLHSRFSRSYERGEWFIMTDEDVEEAVKMCSVFQDGSNAFGDMFVGEILRSAVSYCLEAGINVEWHRDGGTLFMRVDGMNYDPEQKRLVLVEK